MNQKQRYILLVFSIVVILHIVFVHTHEEYGHAFSISNVVSRVKGNHSEQAAMAITITNPTTGTVPIATATSTSGSILAPEITADTTSTPPPLATSEESNYRSANATFVMLARNNEIEGVIQSISEVELRFNKKFRYPYVFLNDEPFSEEFKSRVSELTKAKIEFGLIPGEDWHQPDWIDEDLAKQGRDKLVADDVIYGGSVSYRNMCRFNSGFFFNQKLLQKYRWYWRVEPSVHFYCNVDNDPFLYMEQHNKTYGFTISLFEFEKTIPTLWGHVKDFMLQHPEYVARDNSMGFLSEDGGENYNLCHFWSNFEIADMDFWRGTAYTKFFEYLDSQGGFYYERWGDAPVHSIAAALLLPKDKIHFFKEIGYFHHPFTHCPSGKLYLDGKCSCQIGLNFDYQGYSCLRKWDRIYLT
ncbi:glycosyltransferase family 15 protein [Crucibulum laeve]|uniref:Glycosyltransferase family 15 protein n=1 Tax=Crucibulum laeve TaxID=68775 RepID=A0A5C3M038_9AGAR|nr:glycosyltransferase family 15 protein [Crucibulum laeve]